MDSTHTDTRLVNAFIVLQITGGVGFTLILLTALCSSRVVRHRTWFNFCFSWILWGISFSLLFFSGQQDIITSRPLCIAQSVLVYTVPLFAGFTTVALIIYLLLTIRSTLVPKGVTKRRSWEKLTPRLLVSIPWFLGIAILVSFLAYALKHPNDVQLSHNGTYCVVTNSFLPKIMAVAGTLMGLIIIILEVVIGTILYRHRNIINGVPQSLSLTIQLILFTASVLCSAGVDLVYVITKARGAVFDIMLGVLPVAASVIFGTQRDILVSWMFWKCQTPLVQPHPQAEPRAGQFCPAGLEVQP